MVNSLFIQGTLPTWLKRDVRSLIRIYKTFYPQMRCRTDDDFSVSELCREFKLSRFDDF